MVVTDSKPLRSSTGARLFLVWAIALGVVIAVNVLQSRFDTLENAGALGMTEFFAGIILIAVGLYLVVLAIRWMMHKLFWRVGRRLFLSYILIGVLPFALMAILALALGFMVAGVMSQAALRNERSATLAQLESWALEYGLTGKKPKGALPTMEVHDSDVNAAPIPRWLRTSTFSGPCSRNRAPLLVASRQFASAAGGATRTVVMVQPMDQHWTRALEDKGGMIVRVAPEDQDHEGKGVTIERNDRRTDFEEPKDIEKLFGQSIGRRIIWGDITQLTDWERGSDGKPLQLFSFIFMPFTSLFQFYFGASYQEYVTILANVAIGITVMLLVIYMFAAAFAAVLIFSISRAVNRIEKGTKAVERGDFSYRIRMKPHNQLGEMAQSFDAMTASIGSLLSTVAEKERLQSEIDIAATIQRNLLPKEGPAFRGVSFAAHFEPTASIGGDYYDVFNLDKTHLAVAMGDVSGHGLSTGLVMAMVKAAITTLIEEGADEISLFQRLNELVYRSTERRAFMTLAFTIFDLERGTIRHTNAGHLYPYVLRQGEATAIQIESPSLPLGVRHELVTRTATLELKEGDSIVYLSDGIIEAQDPNGEPFGFEQLENLLGQQVDRSPTAVRDIILDAVARHSAGRPPDDDRSVMVLRFEHLGALAGVPQEVAEAAAV